MMMEVNHEELARLYRTDPEAFYRKRKEILDGFFKRVPEASRQKLQELQLEIDAQISMSRSPLEACQRISQMMMERVDQPGGLKENFLQMEEIKSKLVVATLDLKTKLHLPSD